MPTKLIDLAERIIGGETLETADYQDLTQDERQAVANIVSEAIGYVTMPWDAMH